MSKHYLMQKQNGNIIEKTVKNWAREPQNQIKFPRYTFERPYTTDTTPTSEEIDSQLLNEGCIREIFNGDYYCYNPREISDNDLKALNYKKGSVTNEVKNTDNSTDKLEVEKSKSIIRIRDTNGFDPVKNIKLYVEKNSVPLFKTILNNSLSAVFDERGFFFSNAAQAKYDIIKPEPHLYIAFVKDTKGTTYIGKSFQNGGRWRRSHAYHLGTLGHHLNNTIRYDDHNHSHWIEAWMNLNSTRRNVINNTIDLKSEVLVVFIPFEIYSDRNPQHLTKEEIKSVNHNVESQLIRDFSNRNIGLLNRQGL